MCPRKTAPVNSSGPTKAGITAYTIRDVILAFKKKQQRKDHGKFPELRPTDTLRASPRLLCNGPATRRLCACRYVLMCLLVTNAAILLEPTAGAAPVPLPGNAKSLLL